MVGFHFVSLPKPKSYKLNSCIRHMHKYHWYVRRYPKPRWKLIQYHFGHILLHLQKLFWLAFLVRRPFFRHRLVPNLHCIYPQQISHALKWYMIPRYMISQVVSQVLTLNVHSIKMSVPNAGALLSSRTIWYVDLRQNKLETSHFWPRCDKNWHNNRNVISSSV